jgi:hypothetical protein
MKTIITATAPTRYQLRSLRAFGMPVTDEPNGTFTASQEFDSKEEAIEYLKDRAHMYFEFGEIEEAMADITTANMLTIDAVTAYIETI